MNFEILNEKLFEIKKREEHHLLFPNEISPLYQSLDIHSINGTPIFVLKDIWPNDKDFFVIQHTRFTTVPTHTHDFIELNYVYHGQCTQIINKKKVTLKQGQIVLIDTAVAHSVELTTEEDIIINILIKKEFFSNQLRHLNNEKGIVFDFIVNALSERKTHNQYIIFKKKDTMLHTVIQQILIEHANQEIGVDIMLKNLLLMLFTLLIRNFDYEKYQNHPRTKESILDIMNHIENNFQEITLESLAATFNYTPAYLSTFIRKETGKTLTDWILDKKLEYVRFLITSTSDSISQCATKAGFSNLSHFYKKYKSKFGINPGKEQRPR